MVQTKKQLENLSKEELIEKLIVIDNKPRNSLNYQMDLTTFRGDFKFLSSELPITKNCNSLLTKTVIQSERMWSLMLSTDGENH